MDILLFFGAILTAISLLPMGLKRWMVKSNHTISWVKYLVNSLSLLFFCVLCIEFFLNLNNQYLIGYKTRNFLLIASSLFFVLHYLTTQYKVKSYKIFVEVLLFVTLFTTTLISVVNLSNYSQFRLYEDSTYRIEKNWDLMGPNAVLPKIYVKKGIIETQYSLEYQENYSYDYSHELNKESISKYIISQKDENIEVEFIFNDGEKTVLVNSNY